MEFQAENLHTPQPHLTERELQVLKLICDGLTPSEIAVATNTSKRTIDTHKSNIMAKFNVNSVTKLVIVAFKNHIID